MTLNLYISRFGLFLLKNSSKEEDLGEYSMYTGEGDPYRLATIHSYNNKQDLDFWNETRCNKVHGSDGASFNPYIKKVRETCDNLSQRHKSNIIIF